MQSQPSGIGDKRRVSVPESKDNQPVWKGPGRGARSLVPFDGRTAKIVHRTLRASSKTRDCGALAAHSPPTLGDPVLDTRPFAVGPFAIAPFGVAPFTPASRRIR